MERLKRYRPENWRGVPVRSISTSGSMPKTYQHKRGVAMPSNSWSQTVSTTTVKDSVIHISSEISSVQHPKWQLITKRAIDISGALVGILILSVPLILVATAIKSTSKGPIFFRQKRLGLRGSSFEILKFRSMYVDKCDHSGIKQTALHDSRITPLGSVLRRTNIDELPQLFNVIKGDMSLVGPRPHVESMIAAGVPYDELIGNYGHRHLMQPGITGLAQVEGFRGPTTSLDAAVGRVVLDLHYIQSFSVWLDIKIIARTILKELSSGTGQ